MFLSQAEIDIDRINMFDETALRCVNECCMNDSTVTVPLQFFKIMQSATANLNIQG